MFVGPTVCFFYFSTGPNATVTGWKPGYNGSCYITHAEAQTWHQAHGTCLSAGGYLTILDNRDEAEYIRELFKNVDQVKMPGDFAFLGFSDLFQQYHYRTVHGTKFSLTSVML